MALGTAQLASGPAAVAVVCDGVSTSMRPDEASLAAAQAAVAVLLSGLRAGQDLAVVSAEAIRSAQAAVARLAAPPPAAAQPPEAPPLDAPSATFVSAVLTADAATVCWLGDSRAYWLDGGDHPAGQRLTRDDSLGEEMVAAGLLDEASALARPDSHVVTGWIGADSPAAPHLARFEPPGPGVLLLCSDGLWNYEPGAAGLAALALPRALTDPLGAAASLVRFALDAGGKDNVTVVLLPFPPAGPASDHPDGQTRGSIHDPTPTRTRR